MDPISIKTALLLIADYIDATPNPSRLAVASDLRAILGISGLYRQAGFLDDFKDWLSEHPEERAKAKTVAAKIAEFKKGIPLLKDFSANVDNLDNPWSSLFDGLDAVEFKALSSVIVKALRNNSGAIDADVLERLEPEDPDDSFKKLFKARSGEALEGLFMDLDVTEGTIKSLSEDDEFEEDDDEMPILEALQIFRTQVSELCGAYYSKMKGKGKKELKEEIESLMYRKKEKKPAKADDDSGKDKGLDSTEKMDSEESEAFAAEFGNYTKTLRGLIRGEDSDTAKKNQRAIYDKLIGMNKDMTKGNKPVAEMVQAMEDELEKMKQSIEGKKGRKKSLKFVESALGGLGRLKQIK